MTRTNGQHPPRVVVVGDPGLAQQLPADGAAVVCVGDYLHALGELSAGGVRAIVGRLDAMAGEVESTVRAVRRLDGEVPMLLITHAAGEPEAQHAVRLGCNDYFIEPLRPGELTEAMRAAPRRQLAITPGADAPTDGSPVIAAMLAAHGSPREALAQWLSDHAGAPVELTEADDPRPGAPLQHGGHTIGKLVGDSADDDRLAAVAGDAARWLALIEQHEQLRYEADHDELTGAWNRRYFDRFFDDILNRAHEHRFRVSLMIFDIDDFKVYNDSYGHAAGDDILREATNLMRSVVRQHDVVARIGGDEFAVIFWDAEAPRKEHSEHPNTIATAARRFQKAICEHKFPKLADLAPGTLTISGGLAGYPWDGRSREELMRIADEMLLRSKQQGKNALTFGPGAERDCDPFDDFNLGA